jgi:hypothetical protein
MLIGCLVKAKKIPFNFIPLFLYFISIYNLFKPNLLPNLQQNANVALKQNTTP